MRKAIGLFAVGMFFLIAIAGLSSAYYGGYYDPYHGAGDYDAYYSYTERTSGGYYGPRKTTSTEYDRVSEKYWDGYDWVDRTVYVREKRESPHCGGYYGCHGYSPGYQNRNYYGAYHYPDDNYRSYGYNYPRTRYWY